MMGPLLVFAVDERAFALPLERVERAVRAVAITPLPQAPAIVCGVINIAGRIVPVVDLRRRFSLPERAIEAIKLADQLLITHGGRRPLALIVDTVSGVVACAEHDFVAADSIVAGTAYLHGIAKSPSGMVLIHDLDTLLSLDEAQALDSALTPAGEMA
ncbi:MAG: chemotaxis protein CheW [Rhodocyclaceae bacterium]